MAHFQSCGGNSAYLAAFRSWTHSSKPDWLPLNTQNEAGYFGRATEHCRPQSFKMVTGYLLNTFTLTAIMAEGIQLSVHRCGKTIEFSMVLTQGHSANLRIPLSFWEQLGNDDLPPGDLASIHEDDEDGGECHEDEEEEDGETIVLQVAQPTKEDSTRPLSGEARYALTERSMIMFSTATRVNSSEK